MFGKNGKVSDVSNLHFSAGKIERRKKGERMKRMEREKMCMG